MEAALSERAAAEGVSKAELLRSLARERLFSVASLDADPVWQLCGISGRSDLEDTFSGNVSEHVDDILYGEVSERK